MSRDLKDGKTMLDIYNKMASWLVVGALRP